MIISRQLRIALLISFLWHLFLFFSVSIVFLPGGFKLKQYYSVCFLGSILRDSITFGQRLPLDKRQLVELPSEADISARDPFSAGQYAFLRPEKETLSPESLIDVDVPEEIIPSLASFVSIEAMPSQREIIFQPVIPCYPEWASGQGFKGNPTVFKINISPDGLVQEVVNIQASGNPEIDASLARYIRRWRFAPAFNQQTHWQTIKINLNFNDET